MTPGLSVDLPSAVVAYLGTGVLTGALLTDWNALPGVFRATGPGERPRRWRAYRWLVQAGLTWMMCLPFWPATVYDRLSDWRLARRKARRAGGTGPGARTPGHD